MVYALSLTGPTSAEFLCTRFKPSQDVHLTKLAQYFHLASLPLDPIVLLRPKVARVEPTNRFPQRPTCFATESRRGPTNGRSTAFEQS